MLPFVVQGLLSLTSKYPLTDDECLTEFFLMFQLIFGSDVNESVLLLSGN